MKTIYSFMSLSCCIHYGYRFRIEEEDQITDALSLNNILPEPLLVVSLLPTLSLSDPYSDADPHVIFGLMIDHDTDLDSLVEKRSVLDEFISNSPFLEGFVLEASPHFYSGIPWSPDSEEEEEEESEHSEESEESDESGQSIESSISENHEENDFME